MNAKYDTGSMAPFVGFSNKSYSGDAADNMNGGAGAEDTSAVAVGVNFMLFGGLSWLSYSTESNSGGTDGAEATTISTGLIYYVF